MKKYAITLLFAVATSSLANSAYVNSLSKAISQELSKTNAYTGSTFNTSYRGKESQPPFMLMQLAQAGNRVSQYKLAAVYANGIGGVKQNMVEAVRWCQKSAEQGYAPAQLSLGMAYYNGNGIAKNLTEAVKWLEKAAQQNLPPAQQLLGMAYGMGKGVPQNNAEAIRWIRKAAEQGLSSSQYILGLAYVKGIGIEQNKTLGMDWLKKAAAQGDDNAKKALLSLNSDATSGNNPALERAARRVGFNPAQTIIEQVNKSIGVKQNASDTEHTPANEVNSAS